MNYDVVNDPFVSKGDRFITVRYGTLRTYGDTYNISVVEPNDVELEQLRAQNIHNKPHCKLTAQFLEVYPNAFINRCSIYASPIMCAALPYGNKPTVNTILANPHACTVPNNLSCFRLKAMVKESPVKAISTVLYQHAFVVGQHVDTAPLGSVILTYKLLIAGKYCDI
jgi:hypothetical protein